LGYWCAPCIKELPFFEKLNVEMDSKLDVTLISLDFLDELEEKVIPFVKARNLKSKVVLLDEIDYNAWVDLVDPTWGGAIPFTLIVNTTPDKGSYF
jgi:thiol-disulfide isomerase/thioredoxin